jgi:signal recognition particle GTPase
LKLSEPKRTKLGQPINFIGLGEQPNDLHLFDAKQFAQALFEES